ncbi:hypothetical protein IWT25_02532 [Secundilactobacillus pentosiphilus]|uniref:Uncharacterized protein n=2 Tax=Secundilactobacillus pentosiphilus TaxID=1714682 RepID=A0A1Z5IZF6_9LACO|nr:hypothetical protein IWT25_02532 [Secundilactobacillus pentosiphilus]
MQSKSSLELQGEIMKLRNSIALGIVALTLGIVSATQIQASTRHYTTIPTSLRGHWYHKSGGEYAKVFFSKYHYRFNSSNGGWTDISGTTFPSYGNGHSNLSVSKRNKKGYYYIGKYATDEWSYWKRVKHNGTSALKMYTPLLPYNYKITYYYHLSYYKTISHKFRTADNTDFFYNTWSPAYLDMNSDSADLYSSYQDAKDETNSVTTFSDSTKQIEAKWISKTQQDNVLELKINGQIYYENNNYHDIRPYSASRRSDGIWSNFKPTSPYARLKKGTNIYEGTEWTFYNNANIKTYRYNGSKWKFEY